MRNNRRQRNGRSFSAIRRHGTAALELVLILPLLITIISGAVDLGRMIQGDLTLANAVRVGAEYGAVHRYSSTTISDWKTRVTEAVKKEAANLRGFNSNLLVVTVTTTEESDSHVVVAVAATYPMTLNLFWVGSGSNLVLSHSISMRIHR